MGSRYYVYSHTARRLVLFGVGFRHKEIVGYKFGSIMTVNLVLDTLDKRASVRFSKTFKTDEMVTLISRNYCQCDNACIE